LTHLVVEENSAAKLSIKILEGVGVLEVWGGEARSEDGWLWLPSAQWLRG